MKTSIVTLSQARARAKVLDVHACNNTTKLALCAYDVVTDRYPESDVRLIDQAKRAIARGEFEFTIQ
jgi:hypothetical protein